jgi:O-antigen/teichoic acid export membrane protein
MGVWNLVNLVAEYGMIITLGMVNGMGREVPYLIGKGDLVDTNNVVITTFKVVMSLCAALVVVALSWHFLGLPHAYIVGLGFTLLICRMVFSYSYMLIRSWQNFLLLGLQQFTVALIQAGGLLFIWQFRNISAVLTGSVISLLIGTIFCKKFLLGARPADYSHSTAKRLVRVGMPIFLVGMIFALFLSTDRLLIVNFLGVTKLGLYTPAILAVGVVSLVPNIVGNIMYPRMAELYGKTESLSLLIPVIRKIFVANFAASMVSAGIFFIIFNYIAIPFFLSAYEASVPAMFIILIASIVSPVGLSLGDLFNVVGNQRAYLTNISIAIIVNLVVGECLLLTTDLQLVAVSLGTLCAFIVFSLLQFMTYRRLLRERK